MALQTAADSRKPQPQGRTEHSENTQGLIQTVQYTMFPQLLVKLVNSKGNISRQSAAGVGSM
jgi:hypothetical protein